MALLELADLSVVYRHGSERTHALSDVSLTINGGDALGIVGESGCGKSTLALAAMTLLPRSAEIEARTLSLAGVDLRTASRDALRSLRWTQISYIPQGAMSAFDPVTRLETQGLRIWRAHAAGTYEEGRERLRLLFERVELEARWLQAYPHELSGGMRQRVAIAFALLFEPRLLIADEPTTGLDVLVQREILAMLRRDCAATGKAFLLASHDLGAVAETCRTIAVMYAGEVVEYGSIETVLGQPSHPYTMGLRRAFADLDGPRSELVSIPGAPPRLSGPLRGCAFAGRCPFALDECWTRKPKPATNDQGRPWAACHRSSEAAALRDQARAGNLGPRGDKGGARMTPIVRLESIGKMYRQRQGLAGAFGGSVGDTQAVYDASLDLYAGRVLGLVGGSGSGKSTLANILVGLEQPTTGAVLFDGRNISSLGSQEFRRFRRSIQMVFQDPFSSLNPRFTVGRTVEEPLLVHGLGRRKERRERVVAALEAAELRPGEDFFDRYPHELSGGQRQRAAIARAIVLEPAALVADEPVSMLDVSVRAGILILLRRLVSEQRMAMLLITHDLSIVPSICDDLAVIHRGRIVETGSAADVLDRPQHPYSQALRAAVPSIRPGRSAVHQGPAG